VVDGEAVLAARVALAPDAGPLDVVGAARAVAQYLCTAPLAQVPAAARPAHPPGPSAPAGAVSLGGDALRYGTGT
jgi:hypothetical protein